MEDWRSKLKVRGILVTDAKSLYDHLKKTGSVPKERLTLLDLIAVRELVETSVISVRWVNTRHQLADILTKDMLAPPTLSKFLATGKFSLVLTDKEEQVEEKASNQRREQRQGPSGASDDASASAGGISKPQLSEKGSAPAAPPNHESEAFAVAHGESAQSDG